MIYAVEEGNAICTFNQKPDFKDFEVREPSWFEGGIGYPGRWHPGSLKKYERWSLKQTGEKHPKGYVMMEKDSFIRDVSVEEVEEYNNNN